MAGIWKEEDLGSVVTTAFLPPAASDFVFYSGRVPEEYIAALDSRTARGFAYGNSPTGLPSVGLSPQKKRFSLFLPRVSLIYGHVFSLGLEQYNNEAGDTALLWN